MMISAVSSSYSSPVMTSKKKSSTATTTTTMMTSPMHHHQQQQEGGGGMILGTKEEQEIFDLRTGRMREMLQSALHSKSRGPGQPYNFLIDHLTKVTRNYLHIWLGGLKQCVSLISETKHKEVLQILWSLDWTRENTQTIEALKDFLFHLVSAQNGFITPAFMLICRGFTMPYNPPQPHEQLRTLIEVAELLHSTLEGLLSIVPSSRNQLVYLLKQNFPAPNAYLESNGQRHKFYLENMLRISFYCPSLQEQILDVAIERMIHLDASVIGVSTKRTEDSQDSIFLRDEQVQEEQERERLVTLLDSLLETILRYLEQQCRNEDIRTKLFELLLFKIFPTKILNAQRSKFVQFILFYVAHFQPSPPRAFPDEFLKYLLNRYADRTEHYTIRQSCLDYVTSFLCRANYIAKPSVHLVLNHLAQEAHKYLEVIQEAEEPPNLESHRMFYVLCQSIFYIVTYLSNSLIESGGVESLVRLQLNRLVTTTLNPLKFCCPPIVDAFAAVVEPLGLASSCAEVAENNKLVLRTSFLRGDLDENNPLQTHFPFDPISDDLPHSAKYIEPYYTWRPDQWNEDEEDSRQRSSSESQSCASSLSEASMSMDGGGSSLDLSFSSRFNQSESFGSVGSESPY